MKELKQTTLSHDHAMNKLSLDFLISSSGKAQILNDMVALALKKPELSEYFINFLKINVSKYKIMQSVSRFDYNLTRFIIKNRIFTDLVIQQTEKEFTSDYIPSKAYILHRLGFANFENLMGVKEMDEPLSINEYVRNSYKIEVHKKNLIHVYFFSKSRQKWILILTLRRIKSDMTLSLTQGYGTPNPTQSPIDMYINYVIEYAHIDFTPAIYKFINNIIDPAMLINIRVIDLNYGQLRTVNNKPYEFLEESLTNYITQSNYFLPTTI